MQLLNSGGLDVSGGVTVDTIARCVNVGLHSIFNLVQGVYKLMED